MTLIGCFCIHLCYRHHGFSEKRWVLSPKQYHTNAASPSCHTTLSQTLTHTFIGRGSIPEPFAVFPSKSMTVILILNHTPPQPCMQIKSSLLVFQQLSTFRNRRFLIPHFLRISSVNLIECCCSFSYSGLCVFVSPCFRDPPANCNLFLFHHHHGLTLNPPPNFFWFSPMALHAYVISAGTFLL